MKHITFGDKSLFAGDEAADLLLEYAALLASRSDADTVTMRVMGPDGNESDATFLLDSGAPLMAESTNSSLPALDDSAAISYMREKIALLSSPPAVQPHDEILPEHYENLNL
jgi:hypothetical protein